MTACAAYNFLRILYHKSRKKARNSKEIEKSPPPLQAVSFRTMPAMASILRSAGFYAVGGGFTHQRPCKPSAGQIRGILTQTGAWVFFVSSLIRIKNPAAALVLRGLVVIWLIAAIKGKGLSVRAAACCTALRSLQRLFVRPAAAALHALCYQPLPAAAFAAVQALSPVRRFPLP